jgi:type II secretory pathway pseudopilin PulG
VASRTRQHGAVLLLACLVILGGMAAFLAMSLAAEGASAKRERVSERALAEAREALIAYAAGRPINASVGPGYLPCPDLDNDGWAEATCGSQNGDSGQSQRLGRLPWKTLGLPDLRDGHGERLWYAVSSKYKGLLNCAVSAACLDMTPAAALGTISVRDASGALLHDGSRAQADGGGAVAVVVAPGAPLLRLAGSEADSGQAQVRECAPGECDALGRCTTDPPQRAAPCDPRNYLDRAPGTAFGDEDNADFVDRNDMAGRVRNGNGFIHGPVALPDGRRAVNDRLAVVTYRDVMPRIMKRVALEVSSCLRFYGTRPENAGRYPRPVAACGHGALFGTIPDTPFLEAQAASGGRMLERWWRSAARSPESLAELPTREDACRIAVPPWDAGPMRTAGAGSPSDEGMTAGSASPSWWNAWKPWVFYSLGAGFEPGATLAVTCDAATCLQLIDAGGALLANDKQFAVIVASGCPGPSVCGADAGCTRVMVDAREGTPGHVLVAFP